MLSIGEFSRICEVTTKTLRYYEEINLLNPVSINEDTGYRYYAIEQLDTMLFINRLKSYEFSLEEIKDILNAKEQKEEKLFTILKHKQVEMDSKIQDYQKTLEQMNQDLLLLHQGKSIMSYMNDIDVCLTEVSNMNLLSIRCMVLKEDFPEQYVRCFGRLMKRIQNNNLTITAAPMVLFHSSEFNVSGMDTEFAFPVKEVVTGTRDFNPGLCVKTVLKGSYEGLPSVYTRQLQWAAKEGYSNNEALFEMYLVGPHDAKSEEDFVTEVYFPVKK